MKIVEIYLSELDIKLGNERLGELARRKYQEAADATQARIDAGNQRKSERQGSPITIDGVRYPSRAKARKALGLSAHQFVKKYGCAFNG